MKIFKLCYNRVGVSTLYADMAELVDALSSDGSGGYAIRVRLSLSAPLRTYRFDTMKIKVDFQGSNLFSLSLNYGWIFMLLARHFKENSV